MDPVINRSAKGASAGADHMSCVSAALLEIAALFSSSGEPDTHR